VASSNVTGASSPGGIQRRHVVALSLAFVKTAPVVLHLPAARWQLRRHGARRVARAAAKQSDDIDHLRQVIPAFRGGMSKETRETAAEIWKFCNSVKTMHAITREEVHHGLTAVPTFAVDARRDKAMLSD
jgi:hypothetical protein